MYFLYTRTFLIHSKAHASINFLNFLQPVHGSLIETKANLHPLTDLWFGIISLYYKWFSLTWVIYFHIGPQIGNCTLFQVWKFILSSTLMLSLFISQDISKNESWESKKKVICGIWFCSFINLMVLLTIYIKR